MVQGLVGNDVGSHRAPRRIYPYLGQGKFAVAEGEVASTAGGPPALPEMIFRSERECRASADGAVASGWK